MIDVCRRCDRRSCLRSSKIFNGSLEELLKRWRPAAKLVFVAGHQKGGWDQLVRDTLFQVTQHWGKRCPDGGTVNRRFTEKLFKAMGGLAT